MNSRKMNFKTGVTVIFILIIVSRFFMCSKDSNNVQPQEELLLSIVSGNYQIGNEGESLEEAVYIRIADTNMNPVNNVEVVIEVLEGEGEVDNSGIRTDGTGLAGINWSIGSGYNTIKVSVNHSSYTAQPAYIYAESKNPNGISLIRTLNSLKKEGDIFTMTFYGDFSSYLVNINNGIFGPQNIQNRQMEIKHNCSMFSAYGNPGSSLYGRNCDSPDCSVILCRYDPPGGYSSIAFTRIFEAGYDYFENLLVLSLEERNNLLRALFFQIDGMNEHGVTVAVADNVEDNINRYPEKPTILSLYMMRRILDYAKNVDEAVNIIENFNIWDGQDNIFHSQFLVADPNRSVTVRCVNGSLNITPNDRPWQTLAYRSGYTFTELSNLFGNINWRMGMNLLQTISVDPAQSQYPTIYSNIYDMTKKSVYVSMYRDYENISEFKIEDQN